MQQKDLWRAMLRSFSTSTAPRPGMAPCAVWVEAGSRRPPVTECWISRAIPRITWATGIHSGDAERRAEILAGIVRGLRHDALGEPEAVCIDNLALQDRRAAFRVGHANGRAGATQPRVA